MQRRTTSGHKNKNWYTRQTSQVTKFCVGVITVAVAISAMGSVEAAPRYRIVDLGATNPAPNGTPLNQVRRINNYNQILGGSYGVGAGVFTAHLNQDFTVGDIQLITPSASPIDLSNAGTFIFDAAWTHQESRIGLLTGESYVLTHPMEWYSQLQSINDSNDIVGTAYTPDWNSVPIIMKWDRQTQSVISTQQISPFPSGIGHAFDVNSDGTVVGIGATEEYASNSDRIWHAFSWKNGVTTPLLPPLTYQYSRATKINNSGQVAGTCSNSEYTQERVACTWINGQVTVLELPSTPNPTPYQEQYSQSYPIAINNSGQIIGFSDGSNFFWENGQSVLLNDRIDTPGYRLTEVSDINDSGVIAATAQRPSSQEYIAVLLVPIDENPNLTSDTISPITVHSTIPERRADGWATGWDSGWYIDSPVVVQLASSDDRPGTLVTYYKVDDGSVETYSGQFLISGNGTHNFEFWSVDQSGNEEVHKTRTIRIDATAPSITVTQTLPSANALGWNRTPVQVSYQAEDSSGGSGLNYVYPASPLLFTTEGANQTQSITAIDIAGNITVFTPPAVNLDFTVPATTTQIAGSSGNSGIYQVPVEVTLSAVDGLSGIKSSFYKIDGGATQTYLEPFTITGDGSHSITFWSVDKADNVESEKSRTISIDATSPTTTVSATGPDGDNGWYRGNTQVTLTATDGTGSGVAAKFYKIDGGSTQTYTAPFTVAGNAIHQVTYWSTDGAGNQEQPAKSLTIKIDAVAPTLAWGSISPATNAQGWNNTATEIPFTASDALSGVGTANPVSPLRFTAEGVGQTKTVTVTDLAGNSSVFTSPVVKIDTIAPNSVASATGVAGTNGWYKSNVQVALNATDTGSGVINTNYKIDGGATQTYIAPFSVTGDAVHEITYWSIDKAGNQETAKLLTIKIDGVPPTFAWGSISPAPNSQGWNNTTTEIPFTVTDNLSGVSTENPVSPLRFTHEGVGQKTVMVKDLAGNNNFFTSPVIKIDTFIPNSVASVAGTTGTNGWYKSNVQVTINATDGYGSGVENKFYKIDGGATQTYTAPFVVTGDAVHEITYWSTDIAGNQEQPAKSLTIKIDAVAPTVVWGSTSPAPNSQGWNNTATEIPFTTSDNLSGVASATPVSPLSFNAEGAGQTKTVTVKDSAGNSTVLTSPAVNIDMTAPVSTGTITGVQGTNGWYKANVQITLNATDSGSGIAAKFYKIDGGITQTYTQPFAVAGDGVHEVAYWSPDVAGNQEQPAKSVTIKIDGSVPTLAWGLISPAPNTQGWNNSATEIAFTTFDNLSGVATAIPANPLRFDIQGAGQSRVVTVKDFAGNDTVFTSPFISIDTDSPTTTASTTGVAGDNGWYKGNAEVTLNATDGTGSGIVATFYKVDDGATQTYTAPFAVSGNAIHLVTYWSTDIAGNQEQPAKSLTIKIDATSPTVTWGRISPAPNSLGWNNTVTEIPFSASDNLSGMASVTPASPLRFSLEGVGQTRSVSVKDAAGNSAVFNSSSVNLDLTSPTSAASFSGTAGTNGWYVSNVQGTLNTSDAAGSGVLSTSYNLDNGAAQNYTAPFAITQDGTRIVNFGGKDKAGNTETAKSATVKIDKVAPLITAVANPSSLTSVKTFKPVVISGKMTDVASGINSGSASYSTVDEYGTVKPAGTITIQPNGSYSFTVSLEAKRNASDKDGRAYTITIRGSDLAGLQATQTIVVRVL